MDDDWLEESPNVPVGGHLDPMVSQNWDRLTTKYTDVGYREGISEGKLSSLQEGFDQSFRISVPNVRRLGNLRGHASGLLSYVVKREDKTEGGSSLVLAIRGLISDLGRITASDILPIDREAVEHAKEHSGGDDEDLPREKKEMDDLTSAFDGMAGQKVEGVPGTKIEREDELLTLMERRLEALRQMAGLD
jgi:hypothetical protein